MIVAAVVNWHSIFFWVFAALACGLGLGVLFSSNVVRMALFLIGSLSATAVLFFLAGSPFLGAMQIMIYVGGTLVLLVFGVMLTAQSRFISLKTPAGEWVIAAIVGGALLSLLITSAFGVPDWVQVRDDQAAVSAAETEVASPIGLALIGVRVDKLWQSNESLRQGMSGYLLPFEIVSVHLLVVLVGAAYLARTRRRRTRTLEAEQS